MIERGLTTRLPWAWLIAYGYKTLELRSTPTRFRGKAAVRASKNRVDHHWAQYVRQARPDLPLPSDTELADLAGCILGIGHIVGCYPITSGDLSEITRQACLDPRDYPGVQFAWEWRDVRPLQRPLTHDIPSGAVSWFRVPEALKL